MRYYLAAAAVLALQISAAHAETIVALTEDNGLVTFDSQSGNVLDRSTIDGIGPVVGIDVRPADGQLYALTRDGRVGTIDLMSGQATLKSQLDTVPSADSRLTVDFNPVADRMRIIGSDGMNLRVNVDDGKVTTDKPLNFAAAEPTKDQTPVVVAGAYINSVKGTKETTLYDIDGALGAVFRQAPPNDGVLSKVGTLGVKAEYGSFDISTDVSGRNSAMLFADGKLYTVDLASGKAVSETRVFGLPDNVIDIAVLPAGAMMTAKADMPMPAGNGMQADVTNATQQDAAYLPPKMEPMGDPMKKPYGKEMKPMGGNMKKSYGDGMMPMGGKKKSYAYEQDDDYAPDYGKQKNAYPVRKMKNRGPSCERDAQY